MATPAGTEGPATPAASRRDPRVRCYCPPFACGETDPGRAGPSSSLTSNEVVTPLPPRCLDWGVRSSEGHCGNRVPEAEGWSHPSPAGPLPPAAPPAGLRRGGLESPQGGPPIWSPPAPRAGWSPAEQWRRGTLSSAVGASSLPPARLLLSLAGGCAHPSSWGWGATLPPLQPRVPCTCVSLCSPGVFSP